MTEPTPAPVDLRAQELQQLRTELAEKNDLVELLERRYNSEHQRGLQLELAGQKAEKQAMAAQQEVSRLTAELLALNNPTEETTNG